MSERQTERVTPTPKDEDNAAVLPGYRGTELHGLDMHGTPDDPIDYALEGDPVVYETPPAQPDPIPVYVVSDNPRILRTCRVSRVYAPADGSIVSVLGKFQARTNARLRNLSAVAGDRLWVATAQHLAGPNTGYPLDPGAEFPTTSEMDFYVMADPTAPTRIAGNPIQIAVMQDYEIPIK